MHYPPRYGLYSRLLKRPMDFVSSLIAIVVLLPVLVIVAVLVRVSLGSPVIFKQERPGLNEKIFVLYKFRTMADGRDANGDLLPDSVRLKRLGRMLRSTSLDELPGLFNVLKGDMSLVGPRPLLVQYLPYYTNAEKQRHSIRPGISGLAQVSGRNTLKWDSRLAMDVEYVNRMSFFLDLKIIFKTLVEVIKRDSVTVVDEGALKDLDLERRHFVDNQGTAM